MPKNRTIKSSMKTATSELKTIFANQKIEVHKMDILMGPLSLSIKSFGRDIRSKNFSKYWRRSDGWNCNLDALGFVPIFGDKMKPGYTVTFRNRNPFPVKIRCRMTRNIIHQNLK